MITKHYLKIAGLLTATVYTLLLVSGCGGDGGDSPPPIQPLAYTGNTEPTTATVENAPTLVATVLFGGASAADIPAGATTSENTSLPGNLVTSAELLEDVYHFSMDNIVGTVTNGFTIPASAVVNETVQCELGFYTVQGTIDDITGTGTLTFNYSNCLQDGVTINGTMSIHVHYLDFYRLNATMDMLLIRISSSEFDVSMSGTMGIDETLSGNSYTERHTMNYVEQANNTGKMYRYENYVMTFYINDIFSSLSGGYITYTGVPVAVVYDSVYGSLTVDTIESLSFSSVLLPYPDESGRLLFGGNNSSIQLSVESQRHARLELDIDGITGYEIVRFVLWNELEDPASLNLTDTDGDGMHDSWETRFGLDPALDDSAGNLDGDGLTNLQEYQQGYDPSNPLSPLP
jgi:hypothetical protein